MSAYILFDNQEVRDPQKLEEYKRLVAPIVARHGGRYVVLGGPAETIEGQWAPTFPVMIEFPSLEQAQGWYGSEEYRELKAMRLEAVRSAAVILQGL